MAAKIIKVGVRSEAGEAEKSSEAGIRSKVVDPSGTKYLILILASVDEVR